LSHGGPALPSGKGLAFTGETDILRSKLSGLDLGFYSTNYGKGAKKLKIYQATPLSPFQFGLNPRHTASTTFFNKVSRSQRKAGLR
jgi:hypothetical protein